jgi:glycosyltransferase involved in cell wall biosynthesis
MREDLVQIPDSCLSVVIPCYNEEATLKHVLDRVAELPFVGEIIVVDDGSTDSSAEILRSCTHPKLRAEFLGQNQGKGAAIRHGFACATRPYVAIQDADLEYDPHEFERLLRPLVADVADVVYGSRFAGGDEHRVLYFWHSVGNRLLTLASNAMTNLNLTDMETCYKVFRREVLDTITIEEDRFGLEPELTAKIAAGRWRVYEVGISYHGRTYDEGKKIGWRDGVRALICIAKYSPYRKRNRSR